MSEEIRRGFRLLSSEVERGVAVFGSARSEEGTRTYELAREVGRRLADAGFCVITGGGPGAMEAANRGAREAGGTSVGLSIDLPFEQEHPRFVDLEIDFHYFFARKIMFVRYSGAFVVLPGGYGTLDELFEALTLIQTGKIRSFPVVLVGRAYWAPVLAWMADVLVAGDFLTAGDAGLLRVTDDPGEVVRAVVEGTGRGR